MIYALFFLGISIIISMVMFVYKPFKQTTECKHIWGPIKEGHQYCNFCGLAKTAECNHEWEIENEQEIIRTSNNQIIGKVQIYKCTKCTERKYVRLELGKDPVIKII